MAFATTPMRTLKVGEREIATDKEGYLCDFDDWSEDFAIALAAQEGLTLTDEHRQVIHFLRDFYHERQVLVQVREMIKHFAAIWGPEKGNNITLHDIFPMGGPHKQGNRLAGLMRTKGEH